MHTRYDAFLTLQATQTDECVLWPYAVSGRGYGGVWLNGKKQYTHRLSCQLTHGDPPTPAHTDAAHSCRNRACINPRHLRWATSKENQADKLRDGTNIGTRGAQHWKAKLTEYQVREMRIYARSGVKQRELAEYYGVTQPSVSDVVSGRTWGWLT